VSQTDDTVSAADTLTGETSGEGFRWWENGDTASQPDPGMVIDAEIVPDDEPGPDDDGSRFRTAPEPAPDREPRSGPPNINEWQDFFSRILLRAGSEYYLSLAFRGVDEDLLSPREMDRIQLKPEERNRIARPFAELANKTKFTRKHGRSIVATADSIESLWVLGAWVGRVNRISAKHKPKRGGASRVRTRQDTPGTASGDSGNGHRDGPVRFVSPGSG
jgi:hypothetical protein